MATKTTELPKDVVNMALFVIGGYKFALPIADAMTIFDAMRKAKHYESEYIAGGAYKHYLGGGTTYVTLELLPADAYLEGMINGPRPRG